jgi:fucose permease
METGSRERVYALACVAMFVFGIILGLPGTVLGLPEVAAQFGLTLADRGALISTLFIGLLLGSVASGPLVERLGLRVALSGSAALVAGGLPLFALASNVMLAAAALAAIGIASAGMNTASNALSSELFPEERGRRMNGIAIVVGLGGLAMPTATALAAGLFSWRAVVIGGGLIAGAVAIAGFAGARTAAAARTPAVSHAGPRAAFAGLIRQPRFAFFGALLILSAATEASMAGWTSTYLTTAGVAPEAATWGLSSHWLGLIAGRLLFSGRLDGVKREAIVRAAIGGAAVIAVFVGLPVPLVLACGPFAAGLAIAVIVPTALAFAGDRFPGNAGTLFGALLTLAQVGGIVVPSLIGAIAEEAGVRAGLSLLVVNCLAVALLARRA